MSNDLKFRAWDGEKMIMPEYPFVDTGNSVVVPLLMGMDGKFSINDPFNFSQKRGTDFKVMQFVGSKDVNGQDIYEGDILEIRTSLGVKERFVVEKRVCRQEVKVGCVMDIVSFVLIKQEHSADIVLESKYINGNDLDSVRIVGNIYQNQISNNE